MIGVAVRKEKTRTVSPEVNESTGNLLPSPRTFIGSDSEGGPAFSWALLAQSEYCALPALCQENVAGPLPTYGQAAGFMQDRHDNG